MLSPTSLFFIFEKKEYSLKDVRFVNKIARKSFGSCATNRGVGDFVIEIHKFNYGTNTYVSEAYNYGTLLKEWSNDSYYTYYDTFRYCVNWSESVLLDTGETHYNQKGKGFKLMTAFKGIFQDLAVIGNYDGNLLINGDIGAIKY